MPATPLPPRLAPRARLAALLAPLALVAGCGAAELRGRTPVQPVYVGDVALPEAGGPADGRAFAMRARPGAVLVVTFGFASCPDICPTTLADLRDAIARLGPRAERVDVAFVTVDLARDSSAALAPWVRGFVPRARALRPATAEALAAAERAFGATSAVRARADGELDVSHTSLAYAVNARGEIVLEWRFGTGAADLAHDLRVLLARADDRS